MKITKEDQNLMIVEEKNILPVVIGLIVSFWGYIALSFSRIWMGVLFILVGFLFIFLHPYFITISIDKNIGKITFLWKRLIGIKRKEYFLDQIEEIIFNFKISSLRRGLSVNYNLLFILKNKKEISIYNLHKKDGVIGAKIAQFLNVPFRERKPWTFSF